MQRRPTIQDITWFLDLNRNKQLELSPPYQRRSVWTNKDRRFFLDTIFNGYPCPAIFVHKRMSNDGKAVYDVVDGKQRIETILRFAENKIAIGSDFKDERFKGKKMRELGENERRIFWNYSLPVEQLDFEPNEKVAVEDAFDRLNRNSRRLEPQELRHARYDGWFISRVEGECQDSVWRDFGIVTTARAKRMKDAQFISELFIVLIEKKQRGFDQDYLDSIYARYDDPDDEGVELDTEDFDKQLSEAKDILLEMNKINGCVRTAGAAVGAFYTLWSLIVLHRSDLPRAEVVAERYAAFTALVTRIRAAADQGREILLAPQEPAAWLELGRSYAQAIQGAQTDLTPREERLRALHQALRTS